MPSVISTCSKDTSHRPDMCLPHTRKTVAKQNTMRRHPLVTTPLPKLVHFQKPTPHTIHPVGLHTLMSMLRSQWRNPLLNLVVFVVYFVHYDVMVIRIVPTVDISGAERLHIQHSFHDSFCGCFVSLRVRLEDRSGGQTGP